MAFEPRTDELPDELPEVAADRGGLTPRQRSPRTDPSMRDGDSAHGNPYETDTGEITTDNDTGDMEGEAVEAGFDGGATDGTTADLRDDVDTDADDFRLRGNSRDLGIGEAEEGEEDLDDEDMTDTPPAVTDPLPHPNVAAGEDGSTIGRNAPAPAAPRPTWKAPRDEDTAEVDLPIERYSDLTVNEVVERAGSLSADDVKQVRDFEARHRNRKTLILKLDRLMRGGAKTQAKAGTGEA